MPCPITTAFFTWGPFRSTLVEMFRERSYQTERPAGAGMALDRRMGFAAQSGVQQRLPIAMALQQLDGREQPAQRPADDPLGQDDGYRAQQCQ